MDLCDRKRGAGGYNRRGKCEMDGGLGGYSYGGRGGGRGC